MDPGLAIRQCRYDEFFHLSEDLVFVLTGSTLDTALDAELLPLDNSPRWVTKAEFRTGQEIAGGRIGGSFATSMKKIIHMALLKDK